MQETREFKEMCDQLLHEQLQETNKYKEMCDQLLCQEKESNESLR
jgi:hypothetical protein